MPMEIARIDRERRIETLARNLYVIEGQNRAADLERAVGALLRANPGLDQANAFKRGAVVAVPVDIGLPLTDRIERRSAGSEGLSREAVQRFELGAKVLRERVATSNQATEAALGQLRDNQFVTALKRAAPAAAEIIPEASRGLEQRLVSNKETEAALGEAIDKAIKQVEQLRRLAEGKQN